MITQVHPKHVFNFFCLLFFEQTFLVLVKRRGKFEVRRFNKAKSLYLYRHKHPVRKFCILLSTDMYPFVDEEMDGITGICGTSFSKIQEMKEWIEWDCIGVE